MTEPIAFDKVADIYDDYVKVDFDIPFFLKETENDQGEILELMCGTGRISIPLLEAGRQMTCVDYSKGMLQAFANKTKNKTYKVNLVQMDVAELQLNKQFDKIILPFHSISEILTYDKQLAALQAISQHLSPKGTFILTLQNPNTRLQQADGIMRIIGEFPIKDQNTMILSYTNNFNHESQLVSGFQFYELYNEAGVMIEKRNLRINFRLILNSELHQMLELAGLRVKNVYGDYSYGDFDEKASQFMIYLLERY